MRVLVAIDHHFIRRRNGEVYLGLPMTIGGYTFWEQYLKVFEEVVVLARVKETENPPGSPVVAGGPGVRFYGLPEYVGPWKYLLHLPRLARYIRQALQVADALILRVPGAVGQLAWRAARRSLRPYGVDVIADPWDMYSPGAVPSIVRPIVRHAWSRELRQMCWQAPAVSYVTREVLQRRYPPGPKSWATYGSDVDLKDGVIEFSKLGDRIRRLSSLSSNTKQAGLLLRIGFLGAFAQMYKAPDILLRAAASCFRDGFEFEVVLAGDGKFRPAMEELAKELGISNQVHFLGALVPGESVQAFLDGVDLFILPSRQEGLPRAMVEAMARGLPCIGSMVGGIPELLESEDLVTAGDVDGLARKIREVITDPARMERMARHNWERARDFLPNVIMERKLAFYRVVREQTEQWRARQETRTV